MDILKSAKLRTGAALVVAVAAGVTGTFNLVSASRDRADHLKALPVLDSGTKIEVSASDYACQGKFHNIDTSVVINKTEYLVHCP